MAKHRIPKRVVGYKVPKTIRKSKILAALIRSDIGRGILANALTAGAGAAAAVLLGEREQIADTAQKGARKSARAAAVASEAIGNAVHAAIEVIQESAHAALPKKIKKDAKARRKEARNETDPQRGAAVH